MKKTLLLSVLLSACSASLPLCAQTDNDTAWQADFSGDDPISGWSVINLNQDNYTWVASTKPVGIKIDLNSQAPNDILVSPPINVQSRDYLLNYTFYQSGAFDPDLVEVLYGAEPVEESLTNKLADLEIYGKNGAGSVSGTIRLHPASERNIYIAFRVHTAEPNGYLTLTALSLDYTEAPTPKPVTDFLAVSSDTERTVTLSWTNPSQDTLDLDINSPLSIKLMADGEEITTLRDCTPGEADSYTFAPEIFDGYVTYSAVAIIGENESTEVSMKINLEDIQGSYELVKEFEVSRSAFEDWKTFNIGGSGYWAYAYQNVIEFKYTMGNYREDDWLITPVVELETGKRYVARYEIQTNATYPASIAVTIGTAQNPDGQTKEIANYPYLYQNGFGNFESPQFTVDNAGEYYLGFHQTYNESVAVKIRNVAIYYMKSTGLQPVLNSNQAAFNAATGSLLLPEGASARVYDIQGRSLGNSDSLANAPKGLYIIVVTDADGNSSTLKINK